ncbi:MAG TPA: ribosome small subunit-dependent GTPase A [Chitinophagales bacterium]|nr:ribosome small subunit-dependent GTPase A [Chitinophagales bacterium]
MKGLVTKSTGSWYNVRLEDGTNVQARVKGKLRLVDRRTTNPVNIGDRVVIDTEEGDSVISEILPRENYIIRQSSRNRTAEHILACNLDQAMVMATISQPRTSTGFIDRFLVTATAYHVPSIVVLNKTDLYQEKEMRIMNEWKSVYTSAGYKVITTSAEKMEGINEVREMMTNKTSLLAGHSGVGKSTLINKIVPELNLKTEEIAKWNEKGKHTTTFAEMFELPFGGFIIDTPGIKEFGILDLEEAEVSHYFPEMEKRLHDCRFNNCLHINEPGCAVKDALEKGEIAMSRYENYLSIIHELKTDEKIYD